jgi:hypothetical protein
MESSISHRLEAAVVRLAGDGSLKDRLAAAYGEHLDTISELELPGEVQHEYDQMSKTMHLARALPGDSVVRASVRKLSNEEALRFAALIVRMYALRLQPPTRIGATPRGAPALVSLLAIENASSGSSRAGRSNNS